MKFLSRIVKNIAGFFGSQKVEDALQYSAALVPVALGIVQEIAAMTPNRTDDEIAAAATKYGVAYQNLLAIPQDQRGLALLSLASSVLQARLKAPATTTAIMTAVQLAYAVFKSSK